MGAWINRDRSDKMPFSVSQLILELICPIT